MKNTLEFDYKKATQAINLLACKEKDHKINKMKAIKLIWLADRYHLRKYGRPITGDEYVAMPYGPVGSTVKDIAESSSFLAPEEQQYANKYLNKIGSYSLGCKKQPDLNVLSETDLEALEFAFDNFGSLDQYKLAKLSHKYPEWFKFQNELESKTSTRENMSYLDFFLNPKEKIDDKFKEDKEILDTTRDMFLEHNQATEKWF